MTMTDVPRSRTSGKNDSMTCTCTRASSAVVGSSATISCGSHDSAAAMVARWSWPPDSSWGYRPRIASGSLDAQSRQELAYLGLCLIGAQPSMELQRAPNLRAQAPQRVERAERVLGHEADAATAQRGRGVDPGCADELTIQLDAPGREGPRAPQQTQHRQAQGGLAAAGFADHAGHRSARRRPGPRPAGSRPCRPRRAGPRRSAGARSRMVKPWVRPRRDQASAFTQARFQSKGA